MIFQKRREFLSFRLIFPDHLFLFWASFLFGFSGLEMTALPDSRRLQQKPCHFAVQGHKRHISF